jgi:hypothetical protein
VRNGMVCNGYWELFVERDGLYEFELRRWPKEAGHAVTAGIDGDDVEFRRDAIEPGSEGYYTGGVALAADVAVLDIPGFPQQSAPVEAEDRGVKLTLRLPRGPKHLRARFASCDGRLAMSAYYVYVRRVSDQIGQA